MSDSFCTRELRRADIVELRDFPPPEWQFDAVRFLELHAGFPYFHAIVAERGGALAGMANVLVFGTSAWLGNIIVAPQHRRMGIGAALTARLVETCAQRGCAHRLLIATELGRPVYESLGFCQTGEYLFFKPTCPIEPPDMAQIRPATAGDIAAVVALDRKATAEDRRPLLERFLEGGFVHWIGAPDRIDGSYLPALGQGPVVAANDEAGFALLRLKHSRVTGNACIPAANASASALLAGLGFIEDRRAPRMSLGAELPWRQEMIYARGAGYCG